MKRFAKFEELGGGRYTRAEIAGMTDAELAEAILEEMAWEPWLLEDLIFRAFGEDGPDGWECGDKTCFEAAEILGVEID